MSWQLNLLSIYDGVNQEMRQFQNQFLEFFCQPAEHRLRGDPIQRNRPIEVRKASPRELLSNVPRSLTTYSMPFLTC
jgi:hypothetical protein